MIIQSVQQTYVFNQTQGAVTEPVNGNWLQAYCEYLGITEPVNASWLQALCNHFGITEPLYASWTIALANYYGITAPQNGSWWYALSQASAGYLPVANFTSDSTTIVEGQSIQFTDTSTVDPLGPPITQWAWTFTGGTPATSNLQNPSVQYDTPGDYEVSLEVTNADGSNTKTVPNYITVTIIPVVADFSANTTTPSNGDSVQFTDLSTGTPTEWSWSFTGGTPATSTEQNPSIQYNTDGTYTVALTASKVGSTDNETKVDYIEVTTVVPVVPITEFATGKFYTTVKDPTTRGNLLLVNLQQNK